MTFTDVAARSGIGFRHFPGVRSTQLPEDMGWGAAWGDYDGDGDDDLFIRERGVAPLTEPKPTATTASATARLYRNDHGSFVDVTTSAGVGVWGCGMAAAWADADGDGQLDLVVTTWVGCPAPQPGQRYLQERTAASGLAAVRSSKVPLPRLWSGSPDPCGDHGIELSVAIAVARQRPCRSPRRRRPPTSSHPRTNRGRCGTAWLCAAGSRGGWLRLRQRRTHVHDEQVVVAIAVIVAPGRTRAHVFGRGSCVERTPGKSVRKPTMPDRAATSVKVTRG